MSTLALVLVAAAGLTLLWAMIARAAKPRPTFDLNIRPLDEDDRVVQVKTAIEDAGRTGNQTRVKELQAELEELGEPVKGRRGLDLGAIKPYVMLVLTVIFGGVAVYVLVADRYGDEDRNAAWATVSAFTGFWVGVGAAK